MRTWNRLLLVLLLLAAGLALARYVGPGLFSGGLAEAPAALKQGRYLSAARLAEARLAQAPNDQEALLIAARAYARMEHWRQAEAYFSRVPLKNREDLRLRARGLESQRQLDAAAALYEHMLGQWPDDGHALLQLVAIRNEQQRLDEALRLAGRLTEVPSHRVVGYAIVGELEYGMAEYGAAVEAFEAALKLSPDLNELPEGEPARVFELYAESLIHLGRSDDAQRYASRARELAPSAKASWILGQARQQLGDEDGAVAMWKETVALDPKSVPALRELGRIHLVHQQAQEALPWLLQAYKVNPNDKATVYALVAAYRQLGKAEEANELLEKQAKARPAEPSEK